MAYLDLRSWLAEAERLGELKRLEGLDWNLEIGTLGELLRQDLNAPAVLVDRVKDHDKGFRILLNAQGTLKRLALSMGMTAKDYTPMEFIQIMREKLPRLQPIPCETVPSGPVLENVQEGEAVRLLQFPAPKWHEHDGGRYIGTGCMVITKDPDTGVVNAGVYRVMVHDDKHLGVYISPNKHGNTHLRKAAERGEAAKIAITFGQDFFSYFAASYEIPPQISEFDYAGGLAGEPLKTIRGPYSGLPIPADAEIAVEGEVLPGETKLEGPFGEWTGYYASDARPEPVVRVKTVLYRDDPIIVGFPPLRPTYAANLYRAVVKSAMMWNELVAAGLPGIPGVWCPPAGAGRLWNIISIKQQYCGHAAQVGAVASQCHAGAYLGRFTVVVDDDIDIFNDQDVLWAILTRCNPSDSIEILRHCVSGPLDPLIPKEDINSQRYYNSRAIIDACKPFHWKDQFPRAVGASEEMKRAVFEKWGSALSLR